VVNNSLLKVGVCFFLLVAGFSAFTQKNIIPIASAQTPSQPRIFLLNPATLAANKAKIQTKDPTLMPAYNNLIKRTDKFMTIKPVSVTDKSQTPTSGDKHDYMSLATYAWPNPKTQSGLPYVQSDGKINPEINTIPDAKNLHMMISSVNTLALAYYYSNDKRYADQAALFIKTWFINPATKMNPNLTYAQFIKGKNNNTGMTGGIIDTANMPQVIDALGILNSDGVFSASDNSALQKWFTEYLKWLQTSDSGKYIAQAKSNQRTWYDGQLISLTLYLNKTDLAKQIVTTDMKQLLPEEIDQEGEQPQELVRTRSWDYSTFNLQALCNLADLAKNVDLDLWDYQTPDRRSIYKAVDYLVSYVPDMRQWPYNQITPMNKKQLALPLMHCASGLSNMRYWNISMDLQGKNGINMLIYQKPN